MSLSARNWAWDCSTVTVDGQKRRLHPGEKLTLLCIAELENVEEGCSFPSIKFIADRTHQSERTVQTHVKTLLAVRAFEIDRHRSTKGRWYRNVYRLNVPDSYRMDDPKWVATWGP